MKKHFLHFLIYIALISSTGMISQKSYGSEGPVYTGEDPLINRGEDNAPKKPKSKSFIKKFMSKFSKTRGEVDDVKLCITYLMLKEAFDQYKGNGNYFIYSVAVWQNGHNKLIEKACRPSDSGESVTKGMTACKRLKKSKTGACSRICNARECTKEEKDGRNYGEENATMCKFLVEKGICGEKVLKNCNTEGETWPKALKEVKEAANYENVKEILDRYKETSQSITDEGITPPKKTKLQKMKKQLNRLQGKVFGITEKKMKFKLTPVDSRDTEGNAN